MPVTFVKPWRRALCISLFCHVFLLAGAGYLSASLNQLPVQESLLELSLSTDFSPPAAAAELPFSPAQAAAGEAAPPSSFDPSLPADSVPETAAVSTATVTAAPLTMTSVSAPARSGSSAAASAAAGSIPGDQSAPPKRSTIIPPGILSKADPVYPDSARHKGATGTVVLRLQILENGRPGSIEVARSSGHAELDEAAAAAMRYWRFVPAKDSLSGQALACYTTIPLSFRLK